MHNRWMKKSNLDKTYSQQMCACILLIKKTNMCVPIAKQKAICNLAASQN